jgi:hypothetical protein
MTSTEAVISNSENRSATLKYQCTDAFFLTVGSTGTEGTFAQTLLELLCISPEQFGITRTHTIHVVGSTGATKFFCT